MIFHCKCCARWSLSRQLHRLVPLAPLGSTIQHGSSSHANLAVSTHAASFQDSRPRPTRSFLKQAHSSGVHFRPRRPSLCTTRHKSITDYIATLPQWERDPIAHATDNFFPDSFLYQLLQQRNVEILVASDSGHKDDYGSFGWIIVTQDEVIWDCQGIERGFPIQSCRAEGYCRMSLLLFLTHYICYYENPTGGYPACHVLLRQYQPPYGRGRIPHSVRVLVKLVLEA
jgi:hypothetical protein